MHIRVESARVLLQHANSEASTRVLPIGAVQARGEGTSEASNAGRFTLVADGVGEGDARRARGTTCGSVDVRGGARGRGVGAAEARQADVVADEIEVGVEAEVVGALSALVRRGVSGTAPCGDERQCNLQRGPQWAWCR